jgi:hypothetical protein
MDYVTPSIMLRTKAHGLHGLVLVYNNIKVIEMVSMYDSSKKVVPAVMRDNRKKAIVLSPLKRK